MSDSELSAIHDLIDEIDSAVFADNWDEVRAIRSRCHAAFARGHQWWPAAAWAEYRMALDGPPELSASVLDSSAQRYTLGPFPEVAASAHSWDEIAPFLVGSPGAATFAHERVVRGDDLSDEPVAQALPEVFDLPLRLMRWEPNYQPVVYELATVRHELAAIPTIGFQTVLPGEIALQGRFAHSVGDAPTLEAFGALVAPWIEHESSWCRTVCVEGDRLAALGALFEPGAVRGFKREPVLLSGVSTSDAIELLHWAAASGGPLGRRRGSAAGRSGVVWALQCVTGLDQFDSSSDELSEAVSELKFSRFTKEGSTGWSLQLIVEDEREGLSWGIDAGVTF